MARQELEEGMKRRKSTKQVCQGNICHTTVISGTPLTGRKEPALLVADTTNIQMILLWLRVLDQLSPSGTLAFPDFEGKDT